MPYSLKKNSFNYLFLINLTVGNWVKKEKKGKKRKEFTNGPWPCERILYIVRSMQMRGCVLLIIKDKKGKTTSPLSQKQLPLSLSLSPLNGPRWCNNIMVWKIKISIWEFRGSGLSQLTHHGGDCICDWSERFWSIRLGLHRGEIEKEW